MTGRSFAEPFFGAMPSQDGVRFRVMAPGAQRIALVLENGKASGEHPLSQSEEGVFETWIRGAGAGDRYAYLIDREGPYPDPASRSQPDGVHGRSQVVDPGAFHWTDGRWRLRQIQDLIVYELHVGTFTDEGTFTAACGRLPYLRDLGITAVELMPVADFPGMRNWGYDPAALFAPAHAYGSPEDLRAFVDAAHGHGLAVILDVVYNHLGPEGAYVARFDRAYLTTTHRTPWGSAVNLDGPGSALIRRFILDNATHWFREYHVDGLRLDATHALIDESTVPLVQELADSIRQRAPRPLLLYAEDSRNLAAIVQSRAAGGWGFDGVWADDFHHVLRRMLAGDAQAYFADFQGNAHELAQIMQKGWLFSGQYSPYFNGPRGTLPAGVPLYRFVICLQNHDQVGNRAMGDRIHERISAEQWRAASVILMTAPSTPLLFMGQEWAASTPFNYFTDLEPVLGASVTRGRRQEFAGFPEFAGPAAERILDPQAEDTFIRSRLKWDEVRDPEHARALALYRQLLALRREHQALAASDAHEGHAVAPDDESIVLRRSDAGETFWIVARFKSSGEIDLAEAAATMGDRVDPARLDLVLDTEHAEFAADPAPIHLAGTIRFGRPGAVILKA